MESTALVSAKIDFPIPKLLALAVITLQLLVMGQRGVFRTIVSVVSVEHFTFASSQNVSIFKFDASFFCSVKILLILIFCILFHFCCCWPILNLIIKSPKTVIRK